MFMIAITIILALMVLLMFTLPRTDWDPYVPEIFKITTIRHVNEQGKLNYDSYMVVANTGSSAFKNKELYARTWRNGRELDCAIPTMNGHDFIDGSHHFGVQNLAGFGAKGTLWNPGALIWIDYKDATFRPGDMVQFEVYDSTTKKIISRHLYRA
jgi:hypothetical protein